MAKIDRKKMAAFAGHDDDEQPKDPDHGGKGTAPPPKGKKKGDDDHDDDDKDGGDDDDMKEGGSGKFGALIPLLEAFADEVAECADEIDPDALEDTSSELSDDDKDTLSDSFDGLDGKLKKVMKSSLPGIEMEQAQQLAQHLADEDMIDDDEQFAGLLYRFGQVLAA